MSEVVATAQQGLVGKYQPYQEYKDSGVEWLGNVPSHWTVTAVKRFASFTTGWTPPTGNDAYFGGEHLWANISDVGHRVLSTTAKTITDAGVRATRIKKSPKGSLLFSFKLSIGLVSIVGEDMYTNEAIATFLPSETFNISYMYWAAPLFIPQNAEENIYGAKLLNQERIGNASFVLPTPKEQQTIAAFLDYETARIDRLIAQQQRLIELLKEKRQAVISHAVTKGLNPNTPMKNSGIEWLGQVPEHWHLYRLKHLIVSMDQGWSPQCDARQAEEGEFGVMKVGCVNGGIFRSEEHKALPSEMAPKTEYRLKKQQLLVSRANTRDLVGSAAVVDTDYDNLLLCDKLYRIDLIAAVKPKFVALLLGTIAYRGQIELSASGASDSMQNIGQSTIKELPIAGIQIISATLMDEWREVANC
ncbi:restriction endonuclease subunit S [Aeromonas caviae]|uniref:restriction endonuclease subunit S n=1 Tax=Aeromonas caviae TaxID=648 RepID=UPI00220B3015|nr:restriction endonuclease subunit S [Aeromonas caviae]BDS31064.1 type I restriction-modification protein subunit S [Aeromonas caviae]